MLSDSVRAVIRARVQELLTQCQNDFVQADRLVREDYREQPEHEHYALWHLGKLRPDDSSTEHPSENTRVWKRIYRDDETGIFRDIVQLDITKESARFFKVWSPRAKIAMFVKYMRETEGIKGSVLTAQILNEYQN